jgi:pimeloyl-ACP methyl ester carboxylesterase
LLTVGLVVLVAGFSGALGAGAGFKATGGGVKVLVFAYRSHAGERRHAGEVVDLPGVSPLDPRRIYALGDSMGGQEVLLLAARHDLRLAGVAAFDAAIDMAARYRAFFTTPGEHSLPALARTEIGGTPAQLSDAYRARSPIYSVQAIARSGVPLQLWWSFRDRVVTDQQRESGRFYRRLRAAAPGAPVQEVVGYWQHAHEMHPETQLPAALACFGLLPGTGLRVPAYTQQGGQTGPIEEFPPERKKPSAAFSRSFCGRTTHR